MKVNTDKKKFNGSKPAIAFYVIAVLFVLYGAYMIYTVYNFLVSNYANVDIGMWDDVANTMQYFISNCSPYFVYAVLCYGMGIIIQTLHSMQVKAEMASEEIEKAVAEDTTIEYNSEEKLA